MPCVGCEKECKCTAEKCGEGCKCSTPGKCGCNPTKPPQTSTGGGCCKKEADSGDGKKTKGCCKDIKN